MLLFSRAEYLSSHVESVVDPGSTCQVIVLFSIPLAGDVGSLWVGTYVDYFYCLLILLLLVYYFSSDPRLPFLFLE